MRKIKKIMIILLMIVGISFATEIDLLVEKLVEKGILTKEEAQKIVEEAKKETKEQEKTVKKDIDKISKWIKDTKFKGDIRLRYDYSQVTGDPYRDRTRIRFRWGFDTMVNEGLDVGFRIATGESTDPTSSNQTFTNAFSDKKIWLDLAYLKYTFASIPTLSFTGGKMKNPFISTDLVWDGDINPEGFIIQKTFPVKREEKTISEFFITGGYFPVLEIKNDVKDPYMLGMQLGYRGKIGQKDLKTAIAYYDYNYIADSKASSISPDYYNKGNTLYTVGGEKYYRYNYDILDAYIEFTPFEFISKGNKIPFTLYGEYVKNISSSVTENNNGFICGFRVGSAKKQNTWEIKYDYRRLEADAIIEFMPDSDFGGTDIKGHMIGFKYALTNNSSIGISYLISNALGINKTKDVKTLQIDFVVSF